MDQLTWAIVLAGLLLLIIVVMARLRKSRRRQVSAAHTFTARHYSQGDSGLLIMLFWCIGGFLWIGRLVWRLVMAIVRLPVTMVTLTYRLWKVCRKRFFGGLLKLFLWPRMAKRIPHSTQLKRLFVWVVLAYYTDEPQKLQTFCDRLGAGLTRPLAGE